jgi:predicted peptidase
VFFYKDFGMLNETKKDGRLRYKVFCPPEQKLEGKRPVLCFLHGSGEHDGCLKIEEAIARHGPLKDNKETKEAVGDRFIVIFPQLPAPGGDVWGDYAGEVKTIVEAVWEEYRGDTERTYLTGFSFGGNGVFDVASKQPDIWAALWPVDPTLKPFPKSKRPVWLSLGDRSRGKNEVESLNALGFQEVKQGQDNPDGYYLYTDYGKDHTATATLSYQDNRVYNWLLKMHLTVNLF